MKLHYYGTQNSKVDEARFRPVWISERDGKSILGNKRAGERFQAWTGLVSDTPEFVLANVILKTNGRLTKSSLQAVRTLSLRHAVM